VTVGTMTKVYCTAPWNGITIREDGTVKTCCNGLASLGNLNTSSINDIEKSTVLAEIKNALITNTPHKNCQSCRQADLISGYSSLRDHYNTSYPTINENGLCFVDLRWNNTCNLHCLYCSPDFSSTWAEKLNVVSERPVKSYQDELLEWLLTKIDSIKEIMLVGGEPMLMKQNYVLFSKLPKNTRISIITNLSYDITKLPCLPDLLNRPVENIIWNISLENIGKKFEYIRSGAEWDIVEKNLIFLIKHWPETVGIAAVYCLFSAFDLPTTVQRLNSLGIKKIKLNPVGGHKTINVSYLPTEIKQQAKDALILAAQLHKNSIHPDDVDFYPLQGVNEIISGLDNTVPTMSLKEFQDKIDWYDQWATLSFSDVWPELFASIKEKLI
jgi:radical SAM protein with 4Fe4S-binding SPASM domain